MRGAGTDLAGITEAATTLNFILYAGNRLPFFPSEDDAPAARAQLRSRDVELPGSPLCPSVPSVVTDFRRGLSCNENDLPHFHLLLILRNLHLPPQLFLHQVAQQAGGIRLSMNQVRGGGLVLERPQPLQQLRRIGMVAELFERRRLGADRHEVAEY